MTPVLLLLVAGAATPVLTALALVALRRPSRLVAAAGSGAGAGLTALAAALIDADVFDVGQVISVPLQVDAVAATLAPALGVVSLAALLALPERARSLASVGSALVLQGLSTALLVVGHLPLLLALEVLKIATVLWALRGGRTGRIAALTLTPSAIGMSAVTLLLVATDGAAAPLSTHVTTLAEHPSWLLLLGGSALMRLGIPPAHGWLVTAFEELEPSQVLPLAVPASALVILVRLVEPALAELGEAAHAPIVIGALLLALLAQGLAFVQTSMRRALGFSVVAGLCVLLVGVVDPDPIGRVGGVAHWGAWVVATGGFSLAVGAATSRLGTIDLRKHHALGEKAPRLGALFVLLGFATAAGPGTVDFVGADLMLHGSLGHHWPQMALLLTVMGLQGLNVLRWFFRIFYGAAPMFADPRERMELLPRERVALLMVLGLLFVGGLVPSALPVLGASAEP